MNSLQVLIVEDNKSFVLEAEMIIDDLGFELLKSVDNSIDALKIIEKDNPDLILMDIGINGGMNGIEIAEIIKDRQIPIIFMTSSTDPKVFQHAQSVLPVSYLVKPFDALTLQSTIEHTVRKIMLPEAIEEDEAEWLGEEVLNGSIFVKKNNRLERIDLGEVDWIKADGNYCYIIVGKKRYAVKISMKKIMSFLKGNKYAQIHKSYATALAKIETIDFNNNEVIVEGKSLPLGRSYKDKLLEMLKVLK